MLIHVKTIGGDLVLIPLPPSLLVERRRLEKIMDPSFQTNNHFEPITGYCFNIKMNKKIKMVFYFSIISLILLIHAIA